jgi:hypothetical protein
MLPGKVNKREQELNVYVIPTEFNLEEFIEQNTFGVVLDSVQLNAVADAIATKELQKSSEIIKLIYDMNEEFTSDPKNTIEVSENGETTLKTAKGGGVPLDKKLSTKKPPASQSEEVGNAGGDNDAGSRKNTYNFIIKTPFIDNVKTLAGAIEARGIASKRQPDSILIRPKPDVVSKIFILPEWLSTNRTELNNAVHATTDFALQQVREQEAEKWQIIETFGDDILYFYGKKPTVYHFSGNLINTNDHQWKNDFYNNYKEIMRGTKCAENRTRMYMLYDDVIVEGYALDLSMSMNANEPKLVPFSFSMFITNHTTIDTRLLEDITPATPSYQYEKRMMRQLIEEMTLRKWDIEAYKEGIAKGNEYSDKKFGWWGR